MADVPFSALYDQVMPYLPGADLPLVDFQIRKIARDFMKRTTIQREDFTFVTQAGVPTYQLTPAYGEVCSILTVWEGDNRNPLGVATEDRRGRVDAGSPRMWWSMLPSMPTIFPTPDGEYTITINAAVCPTLADTMLPEVVVAQHAEALGAGVLAAMMGMPGKPFTQSQASRSNGLMYSGAVRTIRATIREGGQPNHSTITALRRFGK
jgi:hypothetical protein